MSPSDLNFPTRLRSEDGAELRGAKAVQRVSRDVPAQDAASVMNATGGEVANPAAAVGMVGGEELKVEKEDAGGNQTGKEPRRQKGCRAGPCATSRSMEFLRRPAGEAGNTGKRAGCWRCSQQDGVNDARGLDEADATTEPDPLEHDKDQDAGEGEKGAAPAESSRARKRCPTVSFMWQKR